eukprot:evm.model.scf_531.2 EVM.evm.TU.scf_531.2   scf_531:7233-12300(-)
MASARGGSKDGVNVQVLVRCRPRNDSEGFSPQVVHCLESRHEVVLDQTVAGKQISRTFTYDKVFGPAASQADLYEQAIAPIVAEVVEGFNCTIFAYGQTGTGKTYTMEGGAVHAVDGPGLSREAGVIPRAVSQIFAYLEKHKTDYSVRVSFLEVYNEELTDLMGLDDGAGDRPKLKMMDDKNGVVVNGLDSHIVKSVAGILKVLERGSAKRTTAETLLNDKSSRSHAIFTITLHVREMAADGEEVINVGKLNLVDLAGSENITRSGARDGRAREAASINQSLLTLGRVITALVEHAGHVPYRDSKLTRLLRDSLGGKTKTCIIATIAPTALGLEETLNTLDYAHRAKNIRNRPEVNQKISKVTMVSELNAEIEKLKEELMVQRTKNGVFIPTDKYKRSEEQMAAMTERLGFMEEQMQAKAKEMQDMRDDFKRRGADLEAQNQRMRADMLEAQENLKEERVVCEALRRAEGALVTHACGLTDDIHRWAKESELLFTKLDRFVAMDSNNRAMADELKQLVSERLANMSNGVNQMLESHQAHCTAVLRSLDESTKRADSGAQALKEKLSKLATGADGMREAFGAAIRELQSVGDDATEKMMASATSCAEGAETIVKNATGKCKEAYDALCTSISTQREQFHSFSSSQQRRVESIMSGTRSTSSEIRSKLAGVKRSADEMQTTIEVGIQESRSVLDSLSHEYNECWDRAGQELCQKVSQLVSCFASEMNDRMNSVKDRVAEKQRKGMEVCASHVRGIEAVGSQFQVHEKNLEDEAASFFGDLPAAAAKVAQGFDTCAESSRRLHVSSADAIRESLSVVNDHLASVRSVMLQGQSVTEGVVTQTEDRSRAVEKLIQELKGKCEVDIDAGVKATEASMQQVGVDVQAGHQLVQDFGGIHSAAAKDVIEGATEMLEGKLQWDDGAPELPDRRRQELPSKEDIQRLQAPPREVLCCASGDLGAGSASRSAAGSRMRSPLQPLQSPELSSTSRASRQGKEPAAKKQASGGGRNLPLRRPSTWLDSEEQGQQTSLPDQKPRAKIAKRTDGAAATGKDSASQG